MIKKRQQLFWLFGGLLIGLMLGYILHSSPLPSRGVILRQSGYKLISPILSCEIANNDIFTELKPINDALKKGADDAIKANTASEISVYFRFLNSGRWTEVNKNQTYAPASLLKVLAMAGYFKAAETEPSILEKQFVYSGKITGGKPNESESLNPGQAYTVSELIDLMIKNSNNAALYLLIDNATPAVSDAIKAASSDLGIPIGKNLQNSLNTEDFMSPENYSMIFRVLYGGTYLNKSFSEKALSILTQTDFNSGLVAGLPKNTTIAHKFGVASLTKDNSVINELHDCGIVYFPDHPYLLCIMTKGSDYASLAKAVAGISLSIYEQVKKFFDATQ